MPFAPSPASMVLTFPRVPARTDQSRRRSTVKPPIDALSIDVLPIDAVPARYYTDPAGDVLSCDMIDWSRCPDVESVPGRCSGAWVVKDSRVIVESCILGNAQAGCSAAEIAAMFEVPGGVDVVRRILAFANS
jgi:uncharacterized protein (DUF433 family)